MWARVTKVKLESILIQKSTSLKRVGYKGLASVGKLNRIYKMYRLHNNQMNKK
ncbi:hypothetical protein Hanom_Chr09g00781291 [Helianthus anomalus]